MSICADLHRADDPEKAGDLNSDLAREPICDKRTDQRTWHRVSSHLVKPNLSFSSHTEERSSGHRGGDAALLDLDWIVEVVLVGLGANDAAHGADVEAEEAAAWEIVNEHFHPVKSVAGRRRRGGTYRWRQSRRSGRCC